MGVLYMGQSGQEQKALQSFEKILEKEPNYHAKRNIEFMDGKLKKENSKAGNNYHKAHG